MYRICADDQVTSTGAAELRVDHVLEGAVLNVGEDVPISAQLIEARMVLGMVKCRFDWDARKL